MSSVNDVGDDYSTSDDDNDIEYFSAEEALSTPSVLEPSVRSEPTRVSTKSIIKPSTKSIDKPNTNSTTSFVTNPTPTVPVKIQQIYSRAKLNAFLKTEFFFCRGFQSVDHDMIFMANQPEFNTRHLQFFLEHGANVNYVGHECCASNERSLLMAAMYFFYSYGPEKVLSVPLVKAVLDAKLATGTKVAPYEFDFCVSNAKNSEFKLGFIECAIYMLEKGMYEIKSKDDIELVQWAHLDQLFSKYMKQ